MTERVPIDESILVERGLLNPNHKFDDRNIIRSQASLIRESLRRVSLPGIRVDSKREFRNEKYFRNRRTYAFLSDSDSIITILASSGMRYNDSSQYPITSLLIAPTFTTDGIFFDEEKKKAWANSFWVCEDRIFKYIGTKTPIPLDGVNAYFTNYAHDVEKMNDAQTAFDAIASDKQKTREVLQAAGVRIPAGFSIATPDELDTVPHQLRTLNPNLGIVVKPTKGLQGKDVQLFAPCEIALAVDAINTHVVKNVPVVVEERITPPVCPGLQSRKYGLSGHTPVDYNFRVLVTLDKYHPVAVDSLVRFRRDENVPVNISIDAQYASMDVLHNDALVAKIHAAAERATRAICQRTLTTDNPVFGFAGVDVMLDQNRNPYIIEVNGMNSGCFDHIAELKKKPLDSVAEKYFSSSRRNLEVSYSKRDYKAITRLTRASSRTNYYLSIIQTILYTDRHEDNTAFQLCLDDIYNNLDMHYATANGLHAIALHGGNPQNALDYAKLRLEQYPEDPQFIELEAAMAELLADRKKKKVGKNRT